MAELVCARDRFGCPARRGPVIPHNWTAKMIDLQPFCGREPERPYRQQPWSRGEWTFATNGRIIVRVPRRSEVGENKDAPDAAVLFKKCEERSNAPHTQLPAAKAPKTDPEPCLICGGEGKEHSCPNCACVCPNCHGSGEVPPEFSVGLGPAAFAGNYFLMMQRLPSIEVSTKISKEEPLAFRFDGGDGLLMPLRGPRTEHVKTKLPKAA